MKVSHIALILCLFLSVLLYKTTPAMEKIPNLTNGPSEKNHTEAADSDRTPEIIRIDDYNFKIGDVMVNSKERVASINGDVNMKEGLVEYLACTPKGKLHESVLKLFASPSHIQIALILLGLEPGNNPIQFQGSPEIPSGAPLDISVIWQVNGKEFECKAENLIFNMASKKAATDMHWVFTGSQVRDTKFMAQEEGSIIAVFHDPNALIDHTGEKGADDTLFYANQQLLPPIGTRVEVRITGSISPSEKKLNPAGI